MDPQIEINANNVWVVTFSADGKYLLSGGSGPVVQVWRVQDKELVATLKGDATLCIAVSRDNEWIAVGTLYGEVSLWDAKTYKQVFTHKLKDDNRITGLDFSPDSARFVCSSWNVEPSVWDVATRKQVSTLRHKGWMKAAKFSPKGNRIATATKDSVLVWDSNDGALLADTTVNVTSDYNKGFFWFNNDLLVLSDNNVKQFDASTWSTVSEWSALRSDRWSCIALPKHEGFIAHSAERTVTFWNTSTNHTELGLIQHPQSIRSISLSPDDKFIAVGGEQGKIIIESLSRFTASASERERTTGQPSTLEGHDDEPQGDLSESNSLKSAADGKGGGHEALTQGQDNKSSAASVEEPAGPLGSEANNADGEDDPLDVELPASAPAPLFDYDEPPSPATSIHAPKLPPAPLPEIGPVDHPPEKVPEEHPNATKSSRRLPKIKGWLVSKVKSKKAEPDQRSCVPSRSESSTRVNVVSEGARSPSRSPGGPSRMAEGKRRRRVEVKFTPRPQADRPFFAIGPWRKPRRKAAVPTRPNQDTSHSGQDSATGSNRAGPPAQQANEALASQTSEDRVEDTSRGGTGGVNPKNMYSVQSANNGSTPSVGDINVTVRTPLAFSDV